MGYDVSPYLLVPCRDLPTACQQIHRAKGLSSPPCGACDLSDMCKTVFLRQTNAVALLPRPAKGNAAQTTTILSGRKTAA